jgi:hypothetical protein
MWQVKNQQVVTTYLSAVTFLNINSQFILHTGGAVGSVEERNPT